MAGEYSTGTEFHKEGPVVKVDQDLRRCERSLWPDQPPTHNPTPHVDFWSQRDAVHLEVQVSSIIDTIDKFRLEQNYFLFLL